MPLIPDEWIERIKHEVLVEELARRIGAELKPVGQELMTRCPFPPHEDSTPSLSINRERNLFQCFGCGVAGTPIDWVMKEKGVDFRRAVELLLEQFFPELWEELRTSSPQRRGTRQSAPVLPCPFQLEADEQTTLNEYVDHCHALFKESAEPQDLLTRRGLDSLELVRRFKPGYQDRTLGLRLPTPTTKAGEAVRERFQKLGLIRQSGHAHFVGSLLIPTIDLQGNVTGIYGRKTCDHLNKNHASPRHLYLPGIDDDVFNEEGFVGAGTSMMADNAREMILTEARLDAWSFWRYAFRNVTASRGVHLSPALLDAFVRHRIERCFIAYDRDEAGDAGARKAAEKLLHAGVECFRVNFPKGMDANDVILKMQPADKTLALFLRSAEWMGNGHRPRGVPLPNVPSAHDAQPAPSSVATAEPAIAPAAAAPSTSEATEGESVGAPEEETASPASPVDRFAQGEAHEDAPAANAEPAPAAAQTSSSAPTRVTPAMTPGLVKLLDDEAELLFEDRRYRVRGLSKCLGFGSLRVTLKAEREGVDFSPPSPISGWHLDTLDLVSHRQRVAFEREAAKELGLKDDVVRFDLGRILRVLELVQEERIAQATAPRLKTVTLTEKETQEALDFWKSADLFTRIADDYTRCGLVGELTNKIATYIGATSRLLERPLAIIIQSSSAAGKSTLMEKTLAFMSEEMKEKYTAVSGKSLFYLDEGTTLKHKILAIVEEEGAERATYPLKILQSEGELVMASTGKDPHTGKLVTKIYRVEGPVMILLTTTAVEIDPELENRCLRLTVDESREQTKAIHELQRMEMTHEGHLLSAEREEIQKLHRNAQRLLRRLRVHNPYARHLSFVTDQTRMRRDHAKYLVLIETIALMHQFQRTVYRRDVSGRSEEYIDVTLFDVELAGELVGEILGKHLQDLAPQTQTFLHALEEMVTKLCEKNGVERCDLRFTRRQIRELTGWSDTAVRIHMARLIELEYVLVHKGSRGQSFVYELLYNGEGKDGRPFVLGLVDVERLRRGQVEGASEPGTTATSQGQEGYLAGSSQGLRMPIAGESPGAQTSTSPNASAAFPLSAAESFENALIPAESKNTSYTLRRTLGTPRFNLLRFPPGGNGHRPNADAVSGPVNGAAAH
jgi:DNA primase catalytic core